LPDCSGDSRFPRLAEPTSDGLKPSLVTHPEAPPFWNKGEPMGSKGSKHAPPSGTHQMPPGHRRIVVSQPTIQKWPKACSHRPFPCSCRLGAACLGSTTYPRRASDGGPSGSRRGYVGVLDVPPSDSRRGLVGFPDVPPSYPRRIFRHASVVPPSGRPNRIHAHGSHFNLVKIK